NTFSYRQRRELAEHAYQQTRQTLRQRSLQLAPALQRHGVHLDLQALMDPARRLLAEPARQDSRKRRRTGHQALERLHLTLDDLEHQLKPAAANP
nr:patatin family protein [Hydrogenophaga sp.]